jgi:hypothetical protein
MSDQTVGGTVFSLPSDFADIKEDQPVEFGFYRVVIDEAELTTSQKGNPMVKVIMQIEGQGDDVPNIWYNLNLPYPGCHKFIKQELKRFIQAFDISIQPDGNIDVVSFLGKTADVTLEKKKNNKDRWVNEVKLPDIED